MADGLDNLEGILSCQVCFEDFQEDGAHVPRLLPCTHTLCHTCIGQLIKRDVIECPECREKYDAKKDKKSFPQNKYILFQMKSRTPKLQRDQSPTEKCLGTSRTKNYAEEQINPARLRGYQMELAEMKTDYTSINHLTLLSDGTVAVCEGEKLTRYNLETGRTLNSTGMEWRALGMTEVIFRSKPCLVLSYGWMKKLEFRDPNNLETIICTYSVAPHQPCTLCVAPPSTLFYVDYQLGEPSNIYRLDCSRAMPTLCQSIGPRDHSIYFMAYIKYINENLLAIAVDKELQTFQIDTCLVKWGKKDIQLPGQNDKFKPFYMAADQKGRLFVNDDNKCIQVFSASNGQYLGCLIKEGEQGLGELGQMCFSESTSQLVVCHRKDGKTHIAVLNVE